MEKRQNYIKYSSTLFICRCYAYSTHYISPFSSSNFKVFLTKLLLYFSFRQNNNNSLRRKPISHGSQEEDNGIGSYDYNYFTDAIALQRLNLTQKTNSDTDLNMVNFY